AGQKALEKHQYEAARQHFKRIIDGFPQSEYGPAARLALGDSYFQEGGTASYILAVAGYREFLTIYPSHPRSDYAQFQIGECYFKQRNSPDRDQTPTHNALEEYQRLLELYPSSSFLEQAGAFTGGLPGRAEPGPHPATGSHAAVGSSSVTLESAKKLLTRRLFPC